LIYILSKPGVESLFSGPGNNFCHNSGDKVSKQQKHGRVRQEIRAGYSCWELQNSENFPFCLIHICFSKVRGETDPTLFPNTPQEELLVAVLGEQMGNE
jgi:hypothetical protein